MLRLYFFDKWPQLRIYLILVDICGVYRKLTDGSDYVIGHDSGESNENDTQQNQQDRQHR